MLSDISKEDWEKMMKNSGWNPVELRDTRYHQIIHMVSAAQGAAEFYGLEVRKQTTNESHEMLMELPIVLVFG